MANKNQSALVLSKIISRVLDPIVVVPGVLVYLVWIALVNGERIRFLLFMLGVNVVLPGFVLFYFVQRNVIHSGWDVREREERIPLFIFVGLAHGMTVMAAWFMDIQPLAGYLLSFWILTLVYIAITLFWKISVHVGVLSAVVVFLITHSGMSLLWLFSLVLLMVWARVYGNYHQLAQALAGAVVPIIVLPFCFYYLGLL